MRFSSILPVASRCSRGSARANGRASLRLRFQAAGLALSFLLTPFAVGGCTTDLASTLSESEASGLTDTEVEPEAPDASVVQDPEPSVPACGSDEICPPDSTVDDQCPDNPEKTSPGECGCDVLDGDADGDGLLDCDDRCPGDANKSEPGLCGCGKADGDATTAADCIDECPTDDAKTKPGVCGCGIVDQDTDEDGAFDCEDDCPADPDKTAVGRCGCGVSDEDSDGDGTSDCNDSCPNDPNKSTPQVCGCGVPETDIDEDTVPDCVDGCVGERVEGSTACGCGGGNTDSDSDGTADCADACPDDPEKTEPGLCGCNLEDVDTDSDGTLDCNDACPADPLKIAPDVCGCGVPETDSDGDGAPDCIDECPYDDGKAEPGACGCGNPESKGSDTVEDCLDLTGALVHRYRFDGSGTTATDSVGSADGVLVGTTLSGTGSVALSTGPYADLPNDILGGLTNMTIEVWLTRGVLTDSFQRIFDFGDSGTEGQPAGGISYVFLTPQVPENKGTGVRLTYRNELGIAGEVAITGPTPLALDGPSHVACVFDDDGDLMKLYVDGTSIGQATWTFALSEINAINNWLGRSQFTADPGFDGSLEEFRIYDAALDTAQVQYSFSAGPNPSFLE